MPRSAHRATAGAEMDDCDGRAQRPRLLGRDRDQSLFRTGSTAYAHRFPPFAANDPIAAYRMNIDEPPEDIDRLAPHPAGECIEERPPLFRIRMQRNMRLCEQQQDRHARRLERMANRAEDSRSFGGRRFGQGSRKRVAVVEEGRARIGDIDEDVTPEGEMSGLSHSAPTSARPRRARPPPP